MSISTEVHYSIFGSASVSGSICGLLTKIYQQQRRTIPSDKSLQDSIRKFLLPNDNRVYWTLELGPRPDRSLDEIRRQHELLRTASNRKYFMESCIVPGLFNQNELQIQEGLINTAKANLDFRDETTALGRLTKLVEDLLKSPNSTPKVWLTSIFFIILLTGALLSFLQSVRDQSCIVSIEKWKDYRTDNPDPTVLDDCIRPSLLWGNFNRTSLLYGDATTIIRQLSYLTWRSTVLANLGVLITGLLLGKVITNFANDRPALAGFRLFGEHSFLGMFEYRFDHRDLDLSEDAKYHVERFLESHNIFLDFIEYKLEDIIELLDRVRQVISPHHDSGVNTPSSNSSVGTIPVQTPQSSGSQSEARSTPPEPSQDCKSLSIPGIPPMRSGLMVDHNGSPRRENTTGSDSIDSDTLRTRFCMTSE